MLKKPLPTTPVAVWESPSAFFQIRGAQRSRGLRAARAWSNGWGIVRVSVCSGAGHGGVNRVWLGGVVFGALLPKKRGLDPLRSTALEHCEGVAPKGRVDGALGFAVIDS